MGCSIAAVLVATGRRVKLVEKDPAAREIALHRVAYFLSQVERIPHNADCPEDTSKRSRELCEITDRLAELRDCDLVLECIVESLPRKKKLLSGLEPLLPPEVVLATNTSSIAVGELAAVLRRPESFCGIHFLHPVVKCPVVEVVASQSTAEETLAQAASFLQELGKLPVPVPDGRGFIVNRILFRWFVEALTALDHGFGRELIEEAARQLGFAWGPLRILDEIGLDLALRVGRLLQDPLRDPFNLNQRGMRILSEMIQNQRLGRKTGVGFFSYDSGIPGEGTQEGWNAPTFVRHEPPRRSLGQESLHGSLTDALCSRYMLSMAAEALRLIHENLVFHPGDIDVLSSFGLGYDAQCGGLLYAAIQRSQSWLSEGLPPEFLPAGMNLARFKDLAVGLGNVVYD